MLTSARLSAQRALLVVIGIAVATIVMLIPTQSSKVGCSDLSSSKVSAYTRCGALQVLVRRTHATTISELGRVYASILSAWIREGNLPEEADDADAPTSSGFSKHATKAARAKMLALRLKLNSSRIAIVQSTYEVNLKGDFPKQDWLEMFRVQLHLLQALGQVGECPLPIFIEVIWPAGQSHHRTTFERLREFCLGGSESNSSSVASRSCASASRQGMEEAPRSQHRLSQSASCM